MANQNTFSSSSRFTDYASIVAALNSLGKSCNRPLTLYPFGSDGNDANIIGCWGWDDNAVEANRIIIPYGPVRFNRCTASQWGIAASTAGNDVVVAGGYVWAPLSGTLMAWNRTTGVRIGVDTTYTRAVDALTVGGVLAGLVQTALTAGHVVDVWDVATELHGGITRLAGATARFAATGLDWLGYVQLPALGVYRRGRMLVSLASYVALSADGKANLVGYLSGANFGMGGFSRNAAAEIRGSNYTTAAGLVSSGASTVSLITGFMAFCSTRGAAGAGLSDKWYGGAEGLIGGSETTQIASWVIAALAVAPLTIRSDEGAVASAITCG
jgi:hypothetical protein